MGDVIAFPAPLARRMVPAYPESVLSEAAWSYPDAPKRRATRSCREKTEEEPAE